MPDAKSTRGWFRFSLRTMLIFVTLLCCWLGWQLNVVRGRQKSLQDLRATPGIRAVTADEYLTRYPPGTPQLNVAQVSWVRTLLGDRAVQEIWYEPHIDSSDNKLKRFAQAFPEAELHPIQYEPCHPGCFPRGTLVQTPQGPRVIESLQQGDAVTAVHPRGQKFPTHIQAVFVTSNRLWKIDTEAGSLLTTEAQPLCCRNSQTRPAGELQSGDQLLYFRNGQLEEVRVLSVARTNQVEQVFNLILGNSETFLAAGFAVRSKPPSEKN